MRPALLLAIAASLVASACAGQSVSGVERNLPPLPAAATTTTTSTISPPMRVDDRAADLEAQAELEAGLEVARDVYGSRGTFDASMAELNAMGQDRVFIGLQDAAFVNGVVYDHHDQRVTLYRESASGIWFCIDQYARAETDFGLGDSFEAALRDCNDGVTTVGWKNAFAADGLDESAIETLLIRFSRYLDQGEVALAHSTFHPRVACPVEELVASWPEGRGLGSEARLELTDIDISGDEAVAMINFGDASELAWNLERYGDRWYHSAEACRVLVPLAVAGQDTQARDLLIDGLAATRSGFVDRSAFDFLPATLARLEPTIAFVSLRDVDWALVGYRGHETFGLVVTVGAPGHFFCAVESLGAVTGYGVGETLDEVASQAGCSQSTAGLPAFPGDGQ